MGRKKKTINRPIAPDARYNSVVLSKFIARMMLDGKKSVTTAILYDSFDVIKSKTGEDPLTVFTKALENVKPLVEVKSRRVGGATYQVPIEIRESRREALGMRWIIGAARSRNGHAMSERLAAEVIDAYNNTGTAFKKKEDTHRMAEANKGFTHYRWEVYICRYRSLSVMQRNTKSLEAYCFKAFFIHLSGSACIRGVYPIPYSRRAYGRGGLCFCEKFLFHRRGYGRRY